MVECVTCQVKYFTDDLNAECVSTGDLKCINPGLESVLFILHDISEFINEIFQRPKQKYPVVTMRFAVLL